MTCAKKVCKECPFRRTSPEGYLGSVSGDPHGFLDPHYHGAARLPCHMQVDWEGKGGDVMESVLNAPLCRGLVTMMKQGCKYPENAEVKAAMETVEPDPAVFSYPHEFYEHHMKRGLMITIEKEDETNG